MHNKLSGSGECTGADLPVILRSRNRECQGRRAGYFPIERVPRKKVDVGFGTITYHGEIPKTNVSYYAAEGMNGPKAIHSGHPTYLFKPERGTLPGTLSPGMTAVRPYVPDNVLYYFDDGNVANCEYTIAGLTRYVFAVQAMQKAGY